jgi:hypothetical protein
MRFATPNPSAAGVAIGLWLAVALLALALDSSFQRALAHAESGGIEQPVVNKHPGARHRADIQPKAVPSKLAGAPALLPRVSFLRFDLKQNLTTWPVLSNHVERSPPSSIAS